jgi:hypothetical protein
MEHLKDLDNNQLNLILHNMRVYNVSREKQQQVINELKKREDHEPSI